MNSKHKDVAELAYRLWHERGCPGNSPDIDWQEAERRLSTTGNESAAALSAKVDESTEETFPASDPPASHGPDNPPSNAGDKWKAAAARKNESSNGVRPPRRK